MVADCLRTEVSGGHLLHNLEQQIGLFELADEFTELEVFEDLAGIWGEAVHVGEQVALDISTSQLREVHWRCVVEGLACGFEEEFFTGVLLQLLHGTEFFDLFENLRLAAFQHTLQAAEDREGKDHTAVLGLLEITSEQIGEGPNVGGGLGEVGVQNRPLSCQ